MKKVNLNKRGDYGSAKDKALNPTDRETLYSKLKHQQDKVIFLLGSYAGLRVGEIEQIRKDWIERKKFNNKEVLAITIPLECRNMRNKYFIWKSKSKKQRTTYLFNKEQWLEVESYFNVNENVNLSIRGLQERVYRFTAMILLKKKSIHTLRATAQNYLKYEMNLIPEVIAVILGHEDVRTTLQHYNTLDTAQAESFLIQKFKEVTP